MPVQILPNLNVDQSQALGTGLSQGLQMLAQNKLGQLSNQQQQLARTRNLAMLGIPAETAYGLAGLPENVLQQYFEQQGFGQQQPMQQGGQTLGQPSRLTPQQRKEQIMIDKETKKDYDSLLAMNDAAKGSNLRLNRMEQLIKQGKLPYAATYNAFKKLEEISPLHTAGAGAALGSKAGLPGAITGAVIGGIGGTLAGLIGTGLRSFQRGVTATDTEEFEKLSADFIKDAKAFFGPRLTDADLNAFLQTIPTLAQTDAGKLKVINNLKQINKINELKYQAGKEIIKANKGHRPANFKLLVDEAVGPQIDELAEQFRLGV